MIYFNGMKIKSVNQRSVKDKMELTEKEKVPCIDCGYIKMAHRHQLYDQWFGLNRMEPENKPCKRFKEAK